jgi:hypothetical protein
VSSAKVGGHENQELRILSGGGARAAAEAAAGEGGGEGAGEGAGAGGPDECRFRLDLARLLLRYKAIGGSGFQAAIGGGAHAVLRHYFGVSRECFASPLNARTAPFCSAFADVDAPFGSTGSFWDFCPTEGAYEANPPFAPLLVRQMVSHMRTLLRAAQARDAPLLFAVVVGASAALKRDPAWAAMQALSRGQFGRALWLVPLHAHGFTEGHAHILPGGPAQSSRMASCESACFIWATIAATRRWPASEEAEAALRAALRATLPRKIKQRATKAVKAAKRDAKRGAGKSGQPQRKKKKGARPA